VIWVKTTFVYSKSMFHWLVLEQVLSIGRCNEQVRWLGTTCTILSWQHMFHAALLPLLQHGLSTNILTFQKTYYTQQCQCSDIFLLDYIPDMGLGPGIGWGPLKVGPPGANQVLPKLSHGSSANLNILPIFVYPLTVTSLQWFSNSHQFTMIF